MSSHSNQIDKTVTIQEHVIPYELRKHRRARHMRITLYQNGTVVVTLPYGVHEREADNYLRKEALWLLEKLELYKKQLAKAPWAQLGRADYLNYREKARAHITERVEYFNAWYRFRYRGLSIRDQKTCWGSCSSKKNLNFNYKLLFLPSALCDYVIVHELCHLKELNHSKVFWGLVQEQIPAYKRLRRELRNHVLSFE